MMVDVVWETLTMTLLMTYETTPHIFLRMKEF
jgi:hypothetical protein